MGSFSDLRIDGYAVITRKYRNDPEVLSIFVEADKVNSTRAPDYDVAEEEEPDEFFGYCSTSGAIADRLDLMGFTERAARADFATCLEEKIAEEADMAARWRDEGPKGEPYISLANSSETEVAFLSELSFDSWVEAVRHLRQDRVTWRGYDAEQKKQTYSRDLTPLESFVLDVKGHDENPEMGLFHSDSRYLIRAYLLSTARADPVVLDNTDMVHAGYFEADAPIVELARSAIAIEARAVERLLVLTEGSADSRLLRLTLESLYPHLREFISFLDFDQFSIPGGTGNLMNLLRGFAGAGVSNRVIALFDNDTAGTVQMRKTQSMPLPQNVRVLQLPHLPLGLRYPTLGPSGLAESDINGLACSIELYLGPSALRDDSGTFTPVQWTGFERSLERYQGELVDKTGVQKRYLDLLRRGRADTDIIDRVLQQIFDCFNH